MNETKIYVVASCAAGCAFHSTVGDTACQFCHGTMTEPREVTREQMLTLIRNEDAYQAGKAATLAALGITAA